MWLNSPSLKLNLLHPMSSNELPPDFPAEESVWRDINRLKQGLVLIGEPLRWESLDSQYLYTASPLDDDVDYAMLEQMTMNYVTEHFNFWHVLRVTRPDINGDITMDEFRLLLGARLFATRYEIALDTITNDPEDFLETLDTELDTQTALGINEPGLMDYANLENGLVDLQEHALKALHKRAEAPSQYDRRRNEMGAHAKILLPYNARNRQNRPTQVLGIHRRQSSSCRVRRDTR